MYTPEHFEETDSERITALIKNYSFGMLVTAPGGVPSVNHLPFIFDEGAGNKGKLFCHMAKANPQWQDCLSCGEVLVVFQGPHAYVSPCWYLSPGVPTWNYTAIHLRGKPKLIESESALGVLLERQTQAHESPMPSPWKPNFIAERKKELLNMIVGVEIEITDIQAKFKLSQNRPVEDQQRIIEKLGKSGNQTDMAVADFMSEVLSSKS